MVCVSPDAAPVLIGVCFTGRSRTIWQLEPNCRISQHRRGSFVAVSFKTLPTKFKIHMRNTEIISEMIEDLEELDTLGNIEMSGGDTILATLSSSNIQLELQYDTSSGYWGYGMRVLEKTSLGDMECDELEDALTSVIDLVDSANQYRDRCEDWE